MKRLFYFALFLVSSALLAGCGGGGGGGSIAIDDAIKSFSSWSAIAYPSTVTVNGMSAEESYTATTLGENIVTTLNDLGTSSSSSITISYRTDGSIESISVKTPNTSLLWDETNGDLITEGSEAIEMLNNNSTNMGIAIHPVNVGWEYQTYGIWLSGLGTGSGKIGAISVGAPTAGSSIPSSGPGLFTGSSRGVYVDSDGYSWISDSTLIADVDFLNTRVDLSTIGTNLTAVSDGTIADGSALNLTGTLTYEPGVNRFTGNVTAPGTPSLSGTSTGQFYGPNAQELGGVFSLSGSGVESYQGAYGAKR